MARQRIFLAAIFLFAVLLSSQLPAQNPAPSPPLGWNSWDAYGLTIDEADFRANATVLAGLREFGWEYAVIDEGWYMENPFGNSLESRKYLWDGNGILIPTVNRFPSSANGAGFKPLADWLHAKGLKFGIHIVRGIPRQVVKQNLPIAGSSFHAADAADMNSPCPWDQGNWGVADNAAGQAYYDSMLRKYASWGLDFIKVDCVSDHPYRPSEIAQIAAAIKKTGRPMVLSLSPGPTSLDHAAEVVEHAQMWRIADDHWDVWSASSTHPFPQGTRDQFARLAAWAPYAKPGNWPDADMLPIGQLSPEPGEGKARSTQLTPDEQHTELTLWSIARSPLILGANLTQLDAPTLALLTNRDLIAINQTATKSFQLLHEGDFIVWQADLPDHKIALAFFNIGDAPMNLKRTFAELSPTLPFHATNVRDVWAGKDLGPQRGVATDLAPHASLLLILRP